MSKVGQLERDTQDRVVQLFQEQLEYTYYGNWQYRPNNSPIEEEYLHLWLTRQGVAEALIKKVIRKLQQAASMEGGSKLYETNQAIYGLLRYGVDVALGQGDITQTIHLINWQTPLDNDFAIAEEVTIKGEKEKRPDVVLYVNGIALGVIELKRSTVSIERSIDQNLDNQNKAFIRDFFATIQLVMAGTDAEGLRYGTILTGHKHYYAWKEENPHYDVNDSDSEPKYLSFYDQQTVSTPLDFDLLHVCHKARLLEIVHDFMVFDNGTKKTCRHNQYFGVRAAQARVRHQENGIIWHTQGSGKSLTMVWLAKWIREHITHARILVITDRTELDEQIEGVYLGVGESIYRTQNGADLIQQLNSSEQWLLCSLVHKFGRYGEDEEAASTKATDDYIQQLQNSLPSNFSPKGQLFIFVDECHRTQSGKLHQAMATILPHATFIGFTGTPLFKEDKQKSIEVFGSFIHTYKFDQAVADGVILDLQYEARDIDQFIRKPEKVDEWFDTKTAGLTDVAKVRLKQRWGTMQKVLSSKDRLDMMVQDILIDMDKRPRLADGRGNAMLVCASIYQACKVYELFNSTELKGKCAIVTSYSPSDSDLKGEVGSAGLTEKLHQYAVYQTMLADYFEIPKEQAIKKADDFERSVKEKFKTSPGQMRLLIVVDKLLTGFDAPSATYLYIDKKMQDHGLFQAICRVNRLDGDDKDYGYIIDYKDLFHSLETSIQDYTGGAFDHFDDGDVKGLLTHRLDKSKESLEQARETVNALCEPVLQPKELKDYMRYFIGDSANEWETKHNEGKRVALYKNVAALVRAYANLAGELGAAGYTQTEIAYIKAEVEHYSHMRQEIKHASGDEPDMKQYEPAMRRLLDMYVRAEESEKVIDFENLGLIELIVERAKQFPTPPSSTRIPEAMAEGIEHNIRKVIIDDKPINPKYYEKMSELLNALIEQRREDAISYEEYLKKVKQLAEDMDSVAGGSAYPNSMNSRAKQSLYDNFGQNEDFVNQVDTAIRYTKKEDWKSNRFKRQDVEYAVNEVSAEYNVNAKDVMDLVKDQPEYD